MILTAKSTLSRAFVLAVLVLAACGQHAQNVRPASALAVTPSPFDAVWDEMQRTLQGRWRASTADHRTITASYRTVSRGSALVETFTTASGTETLTIFHRDGDALMLTHYCAQGNQPRLRATVATRERVVFELVDVTNVKAGQGVMQKLSFSFRPDGFDQESVYLEDGKLESTVLHFFRRPSEEEVDRGQH